MKNSLLTLLIVLLFATTVFSQISPPGLGKAQTAGWTALGVRQALDTIKNKGWESMSYIGLGRKSNPDNYDLLYKSSILVVNQEFYHQFHHKAQYSLALSYRWQDEYLDNPPFEHTTPKHKQEFRFYSRISYIYRTSRVKLVPTFRQEFRKFYTSGFQKTDEDFQFRSRIRLQLSVNLDQKKQHKLIASSEQLFSVSKENEAGGWSEFKYRESRFSLYYSFAPAVLPFVFSAGYMNNLVGIKNPYDVHYLAFDIVIKNPFKFGRPR